MAGFGPQQIGKLLLLTGVIISAVGGLVLVFARFGFFKLPGDVEFGGKGWKIYIPIVSCIILSVLITVILWIINYFRR